MGNQGNDQTKAKSNYVGAPYNFIPYAPKVLENYKSPKELPKHNAVEEELYSGSITFTLHAETPVFVGGADGTTFYRTASGKCALPGSSIKGLIRTNMQILGAGSIADDVEDYRIMYRMVGRAKSDLSDYYKNEILGVASITLPNGGKISLPKNVQAGYICKENGKYFIRRTAVEAFGDTTGKLNYYSLSEWDVFNNKKKYHLDFEKLQNFKRNKDYKEKEWEWGPNENYYPYELPVYYKPSGRTVSSVYDKNRCEKKPVGYEEGYLLSSGYMDKKKHVYIIPEMSDTEEVIPIPEEDILSYKRDYELRKNVLHGTRLKDEAKKKKAQEFYKLPEEGKERPVFYIEVDGRIYFGYTPYPRIFYKNSTLAYDLQDKNDEIKKMKLDYARSLLGFSDEDFSYKSRISFEDAPLEGEEHTIGADVVLGEPKLSSYLDYLKDGKNYNDDDFAFRGIKQYWLHDKACGQANGSNDEVKSNFQALQSGSKFCETIHFKNLRKDELGLLLWCIYQGESYQWNIGKAKAYGYGRMKVSRPKVKLYDFKKMYGESLTCDVYQDEKVNVDEYIQVYQKELSKKLRLGDGNVKNQTGVKEFLAMKNSGRLPDANKIRYMSINKAEYQNRQKPLPSVEQVLRKNTSKAGAKK